MSQVVGITERHHETSQTSGQVSMDRLRVYWDSVGRVIDVCNQAEREDKAWSKARCNGILTDCRKRLCSGLKRLGQSPLTEWEQGFSYVLDDLWHTIFPVHTRDPNELIHRIRKARKIAVALEALLAALMSVEPPASMRLKTPAVETEPKVKTTEFVEQEQDVQETVESEGETVITVKVHLTAYGERDEVLQVQIPTEEWVKAGLLKLVFHYGQNEHQPQDHPDVSVGDVVELETCELFICGFSDDWQAISRETFEAYQAQAYCGSEAASIWFRPCPMQTLFVEQCLQPLWSQSTFDDLLTIEHELSRDVTFRKRVVHIGYLIRFWQYSLRCQSIVLQEAELLSRSDVK